MIELIRMINGAAVGAPTSRPRDAHVSFPKPIGEQHLARLAELGWHRVKRQAYDTTKERVAGRGWKLAGVDAEEVLTLEPIPLGEIKASLIERHRATCRDRILAVWPDEKQRSAALGVYGAAGQAECADWIARCIQAENAAADLIDAAATVDDAIAVVPAWPVQGA